MLVLSLFHNVSLKYQPATQRSTRIVSSDINTLQTAVNCAGILFINSSSLIHSVTVVIDQRVPTIVCRNSILVYESSSFHHEIAQLSASIVSESSSVIIRGVSISAIHPVRSLVDCLFDKLLLCERQPTVSIISSCFDCLSIERNLSEGSFASMGTVMTEVVDGCLFTNISMVDKETITSRELSSHRIVWESSF